MATTKQQRDVHRPAIPVIYVLLILELAKERGVSESAILEGLGVSAALLKMPDARLSRLQTGMVLIRALQLTKDPALGYEIGLHSNLTTHGFLGYGLMNQMTLRQAYTFGAKFLQLRLPYLSFNLRIEKEQAVLEIAETVELGGLRQCTFDLFLVGVTRILQQMLSGQPGAQTEIEMCFDYPEPSYYARYRDRLPKARFGMASNQLRVPSSLLDCPLNTPNPATANLVADQLERELALLGRTEDFLAQARAVMVNQGGYYLDLKTTAHRLNISARTLRRKLDEQGSSFRQLLDEVRRKDAIRFLDDPSLSIEQVAERLGYTDPANFTRAFCKWTKSTPSAYRSGKRSELNQI